MRKRDSMGAYYWIINNLSLTNKIILESTHEWIHQDMCIFKIKIKVFPLFYTVQVDTVYQKVFDNSYLFCLLRYGIQKTKEHVLHKWGFIVFKSKNNFCTTNKIKLVWFYSLYTNYFLSKNMLFLYILKMFFTMLYLKMFLEYWIILYIFRISLCVMCTRRSSSLEKDIKGL